MDNRIYRSARTAVGLLIASSLTLPALGQAQTGPGYAGAGAYPPAQYYQSGRQGSPGPGPYGTGPERSPGAYGMGSGQGSESYGMGGPQGGPAAGGPAMAMLDAVASLDLTDDQRAQLDAVRADLNQRQKKLLEKIAAALEKIAVATSKLQEISQEQARTRRDLTDLKGHLMFANMDATNRAEEMLTKEQRQTLMSGGAHVPVPPAPAVGPRPASYWPGFSEISFCSSPICCCSRCIASSLRCCTSCGSTVITFWPVGVM